MEKSFDSSPDVPVAYLTDVEGVWSKVTSFCRENPAVRLVDDRRLEVLPGHLFVFGGDAADRGPHGRRVVRALVDVKRRQPDQVVLLAGNRDINKLRLASELRGQLPKRAPSEAAHWPLPELLQFILEHTMGAKGAFAFRLSELREQDPHVRDDDVVRSFLDDVGRDGDLAMYLRSAQLAFRSGSTLFVHGGVSNESVGRIPEQPSHGLLARHIPDVAEWITGLNTWYRRELDTFDGGRSPEPLIAYQAPLPGTRLNQASVVYGRSTDELGNPVLPDREVTKTLANAGIRRIVVGHTPIGDVPCVLRDDERVLETVCADCSRGRDDEAPRITLCDAFVSLDGHAVLDDGARVHHAARLEADVDPSPLTRTTADTGHSVRSRIDDGRFVVARFYEAFRTEQLAVGEEELTARPLAGPGRLSPA